jgi:hypothetical protein
MVTRHTNLSPGPIQRNTKDEIFILIQDHQYIHLQISAAPTPIEIRMEMTIHFLAMLPPVKNIINHNTMKGQTLSTLSYLVIQIIKKTPRWFLRVSIHH